MYFVRFSSKAKVSKKGGSKVVERSFSKGRSSNDDAPQLRGKRFFLTWSQVHPGVTKDLVLGTILGTNFDYCIDLITDGSDENRGTLDDLSDLPERIRRRVYVTFICVGQEYHEDGGHHFHAFFVLGGSKRFTTRDFRFFDFNYLGNVYHPNIRVVSTDLDASRSYRYTKKGGDFIEWGVRPNFPATTLDENKAAL